MMGYPKNPNLTKVDYENLLSMPEYANKAAKDLANLAKIDDSLITNDEGTIENPLPAWKRAGFKDKTELNSLASTKSEPTEKRD